MKLMKKKVFILALLLALTTLVFAACPKPTEDQTLNPGAETGAYYRIADNGRTESLTLYDVDKFTLSVDNNVIGGGYTLEATALTMKFDDESEMEITASLSDHVITLVYNSATMMFYRQVDRNVKFDPNYSAASPNNVKVPNGKTVARPADPVRNGWTFLYWYADPSNNDKEYDFGTLVAKDITLYARWVQLNASQQAFNVGFDLNYPGAEAANTPEDQKTVNGMLYSLPVVSRPGHIFLGWGVSMFDKADQLAYSVVKEETIIEESTTLYAIWSDNSAGSSAPYAPIVNLTANAINVAPAGGTRADNYKLEITDPSGQTTPVTLNSTLSHPYNFSQTGEYTVSVKALAASSAASAATVRYYKANALAKVSIFNVVDNSLLTYNAVKGATGYYITVNCGNKLHSHNNIEVFNSTFTTYSFNNCDMQEGGITFKVRAVGNGLIDSISETYVHNPVLAPVNLFDYDAATQTVSWNIVPYATGYTVYVASRGVNYTIDNGSSTSFSLKDYDAGAITLQVRPVSNGYNSIASAAQSYVKTALAAPKAVTLNGDTVTWSNVNDATSYTISIGDIEIKNITDTKYKLSSEQLIELRKINGEYALKVMANTSSASSAYSDIVTLTNSYNGKVTYDKGYITWNLVLGATSYDISVNDTVVKVSGINKYAVKLTQTGNNIISVTAHDAQGTSLTAAAKTTVYAYSITLSGSNTIDKLYLAAGDPIAALLPTESKPGYNLTGWYTTPVVGLQNAGRFTQVAMSTGDLVVYANWTARELSVELDLSAGGTVSSTTTTVTYDKDYTIEVPAINGNSFVGWYTMPGGNGVRYTDERGTSYNVWQHDLNNVKLYAYYARLMTFTLITGNTYSVSIGPDAELVSSIVIPDTYNGLNVSTIESVSYAGLENLTIGANVDDINPAALTYASNLKNFYVSDNNPEFASVDGVLTDKTKTILRKYPQGRTQLDIPTSITTIGDNSSISSNGAFANCNLTTLELPANIKTINANAFKRSGIKEIVLRDGLETISNYAFDGCNLLTSITIPASVKDLGSNAFEGCVKLEKVTFAAPTTEGGVASGLAIKEKAFAGMVRDMTITFEEGSKIISIGTSAFEGVNFAKNPADNIAKITIPATVTSIGNNAFKDCNSLESVVFEDNSQLISLGNNVFSTCSSLKEIIFEGSSKLTTISMGMFRNENLSNPGPIAVEKIVLPSGIIAIADYAFANLSNLKELVIIGNDNFASIGTGALNGCVSLEKITIPTSASATSLTSALFLDCTKLSEINIVKNSSGAFVNFQTIDGVLYNNTKTRLVYCPAGKSGGAFILPKDVTTIDANAFKGNSLTAITVESGNNNYSAESNALILNSSKTLLIYASKSAATIFNVPTDIKAINEFAFENSSNLEKINFNQNAEINTIGQYAFSNCTNLSAIAMPKSIGDIGKYAFNNCLNLENIDLPSTMQHITDSMFAGLTGLKSITIPGTVQSIGANAFRNTTNLKSITFAEDTNNPNRWALTEIRANAFEYSGITSITLPNTLTDIGNYAFRGSKLVTINFTAVHTAITENSTKLKIGDYAFAENKSLINLNFAYDDGHGETNDHSIVGTIGNYAFYDCNPTSVNKFTTVNIPASVTTIGDYAFAKNGSYTTTTGWPAIYTFYGLRTLTLNEGLATIGKHAFEDTVLSSVVIPSTVTKIDDYAFCGNENRRTLTSLTFAGIADGAPIYKTDAQGAFILDGEGQKIVIGYEDTAMLEYIGDSAFSYQIITNLVEAPFVLPNSVKTIGNYAFYHNYNSSSYSYTIKGHNFRLPYSIEDVGNYAFNSAGTFTGTFDFTDRAGRRLTNLQKIGENAFGGTGWNTVTGDTNGNLTIPDTVISIGTGAFNNWSGAKGTLTIPGSVTIISPSAFSTIGFTAIVIKEGVQEIGSGAFTGTGGGPVYYSHIKIPASVTSIGTAAFRGNYQGNNLRTVEFAMGSMLTSLDQVSGSFSNYNTYSPTTIINVPATLPKDSLYKVFGNVQEFSTTTLDPGETDQAIINAYKNYPYTTIDGVLYSIVKDTNNNITDKILVHYPRGKVADPKDMIASGTTEIGEYAFNGENGSNYKRSITGIVIPDSVKLIGTGAFENCRDLISVTIDQTYSDLETINANAFRNCVVLESFTLPDSLTTLGVGAFSQCSFSTVNISDTHNHFAISEGMLMKKEIKQVGGVDTVVLTPIMLLGSLVNGVYIAPASLTTISANMFYKDTKIKEVVLHAGITSIGSNAFFGCINLTKVTFAAGSTLTTIGSGAFQECTNAGFTTISIPNSVETIASNAFTNCTNLTTVTISQNESALRTIETSAFEKCAKITSFTFPNKLQSIGDYAFDATGLSGDIKFPASLNVINREAFRGLNYITSITFADNNKLSTIGYGAFQNCYFENRDANIYRGVNFVDFGKNSTLDNIATLAFNGCRLLTGTNAENPNVLILPDNLNDIGFEAFAGCTALGAFNVSSDSKNFAVDDNGILYNSSMTTLILYPAGRAGATFIVPTHVKTIGSGAFSSGSDNQGYILQTIVLQNSVTDIENKAFNNINAVYISSSVVRIATEAFFYGSTAYIVGRSSAPEGWKSDWRGTVANVVWNANPYSGN